MVVDAIGTQLLGDGHTEALTCIGLEDPLINVVIDACRPSHAVEVLAELRGALLVYGIIAYGCQEPVLIAMDMRVSIVVTHACIQDQIFIYLVAVHHIGTKAQCLKVRDDKAPAASTVMLILATEATTQFMLAQRVT